LGGAGPFLPIGSVVSINEGREITESDTRPRMKDRERGGTPACPECCMVWAQGIDGDYRVAKKTSL
jgi:hypothetical protein